MKHVNHVAEDSEAVIAALHELIDALDRRIPYVERVGERDIREQAADLRNQAIRRIDELTRATIKH
jgi:uncharacterized membrane protein